MKKANRKLLLFSMSMMLVFSGNSVFASTESMTENEEKSKEVIKEIDTQDIDTEVEEERNLNELETNKVEDKTIKEDDESEAKKLKQDLIDHEMVSSEKDKNKEDLSMNRIKKRPTPEDFNKYPELEVNSPAVNTKYDDVVTHKLTGIDMELSTGDRTLTNTHYIDVFDNSNMNKTNFKFKSINIPSMKFWDEEGSRLNARVFLRVFYKNMDKLKVENYIETINLGKEESFNYTMEDVKDSLSKKGVNNFQITKLRISLGTDIADDWAGNEAAQKIFAGQFHKSEYSEGITFKYDYYSNSNLENANSDYESMDYNFMFATALGGSTEEGYYNQSVDAWAFPLTSEGVAVAPEAVEINKDFIYNLKIENKSNIANSFYLFIPKQKGLVLLDRNEGEIRWEEHIDGYYGIIKGEDTNNTVLIPGSSISRNINVKLDEEYEDEIFNLNLMWKSQYAETDQYEPISKNVIIQNILRQPSTVTFETNGGSNLDPVKVEYNQLLAEPSEPNRPGYDFMGWYLDAELTQKWDFESNKVTKSITLFAKWETSSSITTPSISIEKDEINYNINSKVSEDQFLKDIGAKVSEGAQIYTTFEEVDFSKIGDYKVKLSLKNKEADSQIEVTVHIINNDGNEPSDPGKPVEPNIPDVPGNEKPTEPSKPIEPNIPDVPGNEKPTDPISPSNPTNPDSSKPNQTVRPGDESIIDRENNKKPLETNPEEDAKKDAEILPSTGVSNNNIILAASTAIAGFLIILAISPRKKKLK